MQSQVTKCGATKVRLNLCTKVSQMKTLKVWYKFETPLDCPVSWQQWYLWFEECPTGGSTMEERNTMAQQ